MRAGEWFEHITDLGCIACSIERFGHLPAKEMVHELLASPSTPGHVNHDRHGVGMSQKADWSKTICLCKEHHTGGRFPSVHGGSRGKTLKDFEAAYGTVQELNEYTQEIVAHKIQLERSW